MLPLNQVLASVLVLSLEKNICLRHVMLVLTILIYGKIKSFVDQITTTATKLASTVARASVYKITMPVSRIVIE